MSHLQFSSIKMLIPALVTGILLTACGGGGGSLALSDVGSGGTGFISGNVTAGPVGSANVTAYAVTAGQMGARIGSATTDVNGNFTMNVGAYAGSVMLQANGGSYTDEATGTVMPMANGDVMTAIVPAVAAGSSNAGVQITPLTAMAQAMAHHMSGGMTDANIAAANLAIGNQFSVSDVLHIQPMNPLVSGSGSGASLDAQNYGMTLAAMSKYAQTLDLSSSSSIVTAMMNDASDGVLDGMASGASVQMVGMGGSMMLPVTAGTNGMATAMNAFMYSAQNKSGVVTTDLMSKLSVATGQIQNSVPVTTTAMLRGTAFNGLVNSGTVSAYAVNGGMLGAQIASAVVDGQGNFTMPLGSYSGPVMLQMHGATYMDEATKTLMTMAPSDVMTAVLPSVTGAANVTGVMVTPVTSMAQSRAMGMSGGMTDANMAAANAAMGNYFSISDILHTQPMDPVASGSGANASQDARNYGLTVAAMSEYAQSLTMPVSSTLVMSMMQDAADGVMNGKNGMTQISMTMGTMMGTMMAATVGTTGLADAMTSFMNSSANLSGLTLTDMQAFMQKLNSSGGQI
ncbi:MAG: hypothetical protein M0P52_07240 [Rhodoferax sp.]|nr:hypothetical protein [Rhodoferax sp.]